MAYASSSLLLDSQLGEFDFEAAAEQQQEEDQLQDQLEAEDTRSEVRGATLASHLNPSHGAAGALVPHLRWLCACTGIATAAAASKEAIAAAAAAHNTPGDANSAITAVANIEQVVMDNDGAASIAPLLSLLLLGERTATAAATTTDADSADSLTLTQSSATSSSSASSGTGVSVPGILSILRTLVSTTRLDPVRAALLSLLLQTCQKHAYYLKPHLSALIHLCLFVVRAEKLGRLREKSMELLCFLLMLVHSYRLDISGQSEFTPPRDIIQQLFNEIGVSKSKLSQTMRGNLLATLGLLSELHESEFRRSPEFARNLANLYGRALTDEFESAREPNRRVIEGCLIGLKHFLLFFSVHFRLRHSVPVLRLETIYRSVRMSLHIADNRYDILRAGLACFSRHATLFRGFITGQASIDASPTNTASTETESLLSLLLQAAKHSNISVSTRAGYALEAFLQQVAAYLIETDVPLKDLSDAPAAAASSSSAAAATANFPASKRRLFNLLLSVFVKKLDTARKSVNEVSLAVRALGQLSRAVSVYLSPTELRKILSKLLDNCEKLFRSHTAEEVDKAIAHMPDFMSSFAFMIRWLDECDLGVVESLVAIVRRFFLAYPTLTSTQRSKNVVALTRLFVVLYEKGIIFQRLLEQTIFSGIVLAISRLPALTAVQFFMTGQQAERHAYVEYCYLFHNLLGVTVRQDEKGDKSILGWHHGLEYADASIVWRMRKVLFDQMMSDVTKIIKTLDLSLQVVARDDDADALLASVASSSSSSAASTSSASVVTASSLSTVGDPSSSLQPSNAKDIELFLNLVEFVQRFFFPPYAAADSSLHAHKLLLRHPTAGKSKLSDLVLPSHIADSSTASSAFLTKWCLGWVGLIVPDIVQLANKYPLISGFYKLTAMMCRMLEQYHYFDDIGRDRDGDEDAMTDDVQVKHEFVKLEDGVEGADVISSASSSSAARRRPPLDTRENRRYVFQVMSAFFSSVLSRVGQLTDELLYASLHLLLTAPMQFVKLDTWVSPLVQAIEIGKTYRPAAQLSIDVLNKWHEAAINRDMSDKEKTDDDHHGGHGQLADHLPQILPHLYDYLRVPRSDAITPAEEKQSLKSKRSGGTNASASDSSEFDLITRILEFLGRVGGDNRFLLVREETSAGATSASAAADAAVPWEATHSIKYALPLSQKLDVCLDQLVPQLAHLAEFSTDRRLQVSSCEALHSIVIFMIATTARDPNRTAASASDNTTPIEESAFLAIYVRLFPILIRLATSVEQVTKQLFHPLVFQLIHWFTNTNTTLFKDSRALLDAVTDAVGSDTGGARREYAAEALAEFFKWSLKHATGAAVPVAATMARESRRRSAAATASTTSEEEKAVVELPTASVGASLNTKSLLRRLYSLALHPSSHRRLGASLTFNKLYRVFRESDAMIALHTLDLLDHMLRSLRLADGDDDAIGTKDEVRTAIAALERIVTDADAKKYTLVLKPADRAGAMHCQSLPHFIAHLLECAGAVEDDFRRECLRLFQSFCMVLPAKQCGHDRGHKFMQRYVDEEQTIAHLVTIVERGAEEEATASDAASVTSSEHRNDIATPAWIIDARDDTAASDVGAGASRWHSLQSWLRRLASALDVYWWLLQEGLLGPNLELNAGRMFGSDANSHLRDALKQFLLLMTQATSGPNRVDLFVDAYAQTQTGADGTNTQIQSTYTDLKCTVLIRFFRLMRLLLSGSDLAAPPSSSSLHGALLGKACYSLVFHCLLRPESIGFAMSNTKRTKLLQSTIGGLCDQLRRIVANQSIVDVLSPMLAQADITPASFRLPALMSRVAFSQLVIEGYKQLWTSGLLTLALGATACTELAHQLLANAFDLHTSDASARERQAALTPIGKQVAHQMLQLAFHIGVTPDRLFGCLTDNDLVAAAKRVKSPPPTTPRVKLEQMDIDAATTSAEQTDDDQLARRADTRKGEMFYLHYRTLIDSYLTARFSTYAAHILSRSFASKDMCALLINIADYILQRRQRKQAGQRAFTTTAQSHQEDASSAAAPAGTGLADAQRDADTYVTHILDGFSDVCHAFVATRPTLDASGSSFSGAAVPFNKKTKRRPPTGADLTKILQLPTENDLASRLLRLIEKMILLDSSRLFAQATNPSFAAFIGIYCQCIGVDAGVALKKQALSLLPAFFLATPIGGSSSALSVASIDLLAPPAGMDVLMVAIRQMLINPPFPQQSIELTIGSAEYIDYASLLESLLTAVVISKNFALLELMFPLLREGDAHLCRDQINLALTRYLSSLVDSSIGDRIGQVGRVLDACWTMLVDRSLDSNPKHNVRYWMANHLLLPLMSLCAVSAVRAFFESHLASVVAMIAALPDGPTSTADITEQELQLQELEVAYNLIALLFKRVTDKADRAKTAVDHKERQHKQTSMRQKGNGKRSNCN